MTTPSDVIIPSKDMPPFANFGSVFFRNQFLTTIELPNKEKYPSVPGKCAIVTGANAGLGFETSKQLLSLGLSHLIMGVRSLDKGEKAASDLRQQYPTAKLEVWQLDMESYESVQSFARRCETLSRIDMVILNAGISPQEFNIVQSTGHETALQVNHLSTILLAILLLPILKSKSSSPGNPPVMTFVNSVTAHLCKFPNRTQRPLLASFDDTSITPFDGTERYGVTKLLCQLSVVKLADLINPNDVIINMVDPSLTGGTGLFRDLRGFKAYAASVFMWISARPINQRAATFVDAVLNHGTESQGCFLINCVHAPLAGWYYSDGDVLTDVIWSESLKELEFAGVQEKLDSMRSK